MIRRILIELINSLLVLLFIYAAVSKLNEHETFKIQLGKSPFITSYASVLVWALPIGEIIVGMAITFRKTRIVGLYAALFLMTMFTAYIYTMLHYSYYLPCSCGGILSKLSWTAHLWFNVGFTLLSIIAILLQSNHYKLRHNTGINKIDEFLSPATYRSMK